MISAEETKKISMIGKALNDRPNIKLDIEGYVDAEQDKYALKKAELDRRIKAQKMKETMSKDDQQIAVENVVLTEQEYDKYLKQVYRSADFSKPRNILGMQKTLPPAEMEKLMLASIEVTDSDLRQLAARRAQNVKELMLQSDIAADRIFIVESKSLTPEKKEKVKNSRADFKLK